MIYFKMRRADWWGIIVVAFGAACFIGSIFYLTYDPFQVLKHEVETGEQYQPAEQRAARLRGQAEEETAEYEPYCQAPTNKEDSDLCAQWANAAAVNRGNRIANAGAQIATFNLMVSAVLAVLGIVAVWVASRAADHAAGALDLMARVDRAYLSPIFSTGGRGRRRFLAANAGNSPGRIISYAALFLDDRPADISALLSGVKFSPFAAAIRPSAEVVLPIEMGDAAWALSAIRYRDMLDGDWLAWTLFEADARKGFIAVDQGEHGKKAALQERHRGFSWRKSDRRPDLQSTNAETA